MIETLIDVEVHCLQPQWVADEHSKYRIYFDDELLTERDWIWGQETYIHEHIEVDVEKGSMHTVRVEVVKSNPTYLTQLVLRNFKVNGVQQGNYSSHSDRLSFTLT